MKETKGLLNKRVSVKSMGAVVGGTFLMSLVVGALWHRSAIKRLIHISRM